MTDLPVPIPAPLPTPPLTTGNIQQDMPILVNWFWAAYLVIQQSVAYINSQITNPAFDVANLPNPSTTTLAQAQTTANNAYNLANTANVDATANTASITALTTEVHTDETNIAANTAAIAAQQTLWNDLLSGTVTFGAADTAKTITFGAAEADASYRVEVQAISSTGTPAVGAFVVVGKSYTVNNFTVTIFSAPGGGNSVTFDWQLIRNT